MNTIRGEIHPNAKAEDLRPRDPTWRIFEILSEFVEGYQRLAHVRPAVSIFGSARFEPEHRFYQQAKTIAKMLSDQGFTVITGGGPGIMDAANHGASEGKSLSVGLNIDLPFEQGSNGKQDISLSYRFFFTRKAMFIRHSCAYIVMPGGFGTLDELFDIITLIQTKKKRHMPVFLVGRDYWQGLIDWVRDSLVAEGTIHPEDINLMTMVDSPEEILESIRAHAVYQEHSATQKDFQF